MDWLLWLFATLLGLAVTWLIIYSAVFAAIRTSRRREDTSVPAPAASTAQPADRRGDWFFHPEATRNPE